LSALSRLLRKIVGPEAAVSLVPANPEASKVAGAPNHPVTLKDQIGRNKSPELHLKRWRQTEEHVLAILNSAGWNLIDVSRQFLGYDLEGSLPDGTPVFVEVKSMAYGGAPFTLTSNEEATAREKGDNYVLALVVPGESRLQIAWLKNPARNLPLTRQCKQWVWECNDYEFDPETYPVE